MQNLKFQNYNITAIESLCGHLKPYLDVKFKIPIVYLKHLFRTYIHPYEHVNANSILLVSLKIQPANP